MTNEQLKELLARAIANDNGRRDPDHIDKCNAQAVIEALAPMMREVARKLQFIQNANDVFTDTMEVDPHEHIQQTSDYVDNALASLPDCWREVPKVPVIGSGCEGRAGRAVPEMVGGGGGAGTGYYVSRCSLGGCNSVVAHFVHGTSSGCKGAPKQSGFSFFKRSKSKQQGEKGEV